MSSSVTFILLLLRTYFFCVYGYLVYGYSVFCVILPDCMLLDFMSSVVLGGQKRPLSSLELESQKVGSVDAGNQTPILCALSCEPSL